MSDTTDVILNRIDSMESALVARLDAGSFRMNEQDVLVTQCHRRLVILETQEANRVAVEASRKTVRRRLYEVGLVLLAGAISAFGAYSAAVYSSPTPLLEAYLPPKTPTHMSAPFIQPPDPQDSP